MNIVFNNSATLNVTFVKEEKRVYSVPQKWALTIESGTDLTSDELDALLAPENIGFMQYDNGTEVKTLTGYNSIDYVSKQIDTSGIALRIVLLKEDE